MFNIIDLSSLLHSVVEFASSRDVKAAMRKLDGSELFGKRIRCIDVSIYPSYHDRFT